MQEIDAVDEIHAEDEVDEAQPQETAKKPEVKLSKSHIRFRMQE